MSVDIQTLNAVGSGYPLFVGPRGDSVAVNLKVTGGGTIYYGADSTVSSSSNLGSITNGSNTTLTSPSWIISASSSVVQVTTYSGGGDVEALFETWESIQSIQQVPLAGGTAAGAYLQTGLLNTFVAVAGTATGQGMFYLDPGLYPGGASAHTPKVRLRANVTTNAVAPACTNLVYALMPVATTGGASGAVPTVATVGAAVCSATILTPNATTQTVGTSANAAFPAAGWYVFQLTVGTGGTAANANTIHGFDLQMLRTAP